ncbi:HD domain-containing protein [Pseudoxanthomonas wuyuanensis]
MDVRDPIEELESTTVFAYLLRLSPDYAERARRFVGGVAPILASTQRHFPYYTRHDAHHGFQVVRRLEGVMLPGCLQTDAAQCLGGAELFLLIAAAYAHDLGMTVFPGEQQALAAKLKLPAEEWETNPVLTEYLRREHSRRGGHYIHQNAGTLGLPENLVAPLDLIMRSHNMSVSQLDVEGRTPFAAEDRKLDIRQLAAILCTADALEFSATRVLDGVIELTRQTRGIAAQISYRENRKHVCICDSLAIADEGHVIVSGTFSEGDVLALAHRTLDEIEGWVQGYCEIDRQSRVPRLRIRAEAFTRRLEMPGARFERLGVRMSKRAVIDLVASKAVWGGNKGAPARELIQNAVEACRYRQYHSSPAAKYLPQVMVAFDREAHTVSVSDNGCGMSQRTILDNFLSVASSRAKEPSYASDQYAPIARFGTGFWSVFSIGERAEILTAPFEGNAGDRPGLRFEVSLEELKDYTVFQECDLAPGTSVTLHLSNDIVIDDVFEECRRLVVCAAVPISIEIDGVVENLQAGVPALTSIDLLGPKIGLLNENFGVFEFRRDATDVEVSMAFAYRTIDGRPTFRQNEYTSVIGLLDHVFRQTRVSVCGFGVGLRIAHTCFELGRVGAANANVTSPRGIEYSLDRGQVRENSTSIAIGQRIADLIHEGYRVFLKENGAYDAESICRLNEESELSGGNVYDTYVGEQLAEAAQRYPDLLCFRLYEVEGSKALGSCLVRTVDWNELKSMRGTCFLLQTPIELPAPDGLSRSIYPEQMLALAYAAAATIKKNESIEGQVYVLAPDRRASMLFDADPLSAIQVVEVPFDHVGRCRLVMQRCNLGNVVLDPSQHRIIAKVQGRWTGAVYERTFHLPDDKPYLLLGRHRVLIQAGSRLHGIVSGLARLKRFSKLAELVDDLRKDAEGFTPATLKNVL